MIFKFYEINKINLIKDKYILFHGKNEGFKNESIKSLLKNISSVKGCHLSRMTGSGSSCYGIFDNERNSKFALRKVKNKFPNFLYFTAKSI